MVALERLKHAYLTDYESYGRVGRGMVALERLKPLGTHCRLPSIRRVGRGMVALERLKPSKLRYANNGGLPSEEEWSRLSD